MLALAVVFAPMLLLSCGRGDAGARRDVGILREEVRAADQSLLRAEEQRDLDGAMALVAPGAVFQPPAMHPIEGQEAIRTFYREQWFALPFTEVSGIADTIVVSDSGDLAYIDGRSRLVLEVSGERVVAEGKYLGVWRKIDGEWLLAAISWTSNG